MQGSNELKREKLLLTEKKKKKKIVGCQCLELEGNFTYILK